MTHVAQIKQQLFTDLLHPPFPCINCVVVSILRWYSWRQTDLCNPSQGSGLLSTLTREVTHHLTFINVCSRWSLSPSSGGTIRPLHTANKITVTLRLYHTVKLSTNFLLLTEWGMPEILVIFPPNMQLLVILILIPFHLQFITIQGQSWSLM